MTSASMLKKDNVNVILNNYEYKIITEYNNYWCDFYNVNDIDADIIFSNALQKFIDNKFNDKIKIYRQTIADDVIKDKIFHSFIKKMCQNVLKDYFKFKDKKSNPLILNDNQISAFFDNNENFISNLTNGKDSLDDIIEKDIKKKLLYMYETLSEKEQELYDILSCININTNKKYTKSEICKILNITKTEYDNYIKKLKKIICVILNINDE